LTRGSTVFDLIFIVFILLGLGCGLWLRIQALAALSVVVLTGVTAACLVSHETLLSTLGIIAFALTCLQLGFVVGAAFAIPTDDVRGRRKSSRTRERTIEARSHQIY
jgi:hypothetical protein